jgi:hypothetical protein
VGDCGKIWEIVGNRGTGLFDDVLLLYLMGYNTGDSGEFIPDEV